LIQFWTTKKFWRLYSDLPVDVQEDAKRAYRLFQSNPSRPGLQLNGMLREWDLRSRGYLEWGTTKNV
jgi:hypothetical protein